MKITFLGYGNMAKAIAGGIRKKQIVPAKDITVFDVSEAARQAAAEAGYTVAESAVQAVSGGEFILLCVKPQNFADLLQEIKPAVTPDKRFLTIAAGVKISAVTDVFGETTPVVRAMPNTPLLLGCGTTALTHNQHVKLDDFTFVKSVFASVGTVYELEEAMFNEVLNVNGSTPAYVYLFAKTIAEYAAQGGIAYDTALHMVCDTLCGSAEMMRSSGKSVDELITMVSSKGGTTVAALEQFKQNGFEESLRAGMQACVKRAEELSL